MDVNDAKTFSISGNVSAERGYYPGMPYYPVNNVAQPPVLLPGRKWGFQKINYCSKATISANFYFVSLITTMLKRNPY
jgi:hypothetical protein